MSGLSLHERLCDETLKPFHENMLVQFSAMKASIESGQPMEVGDQNVLVFLYDICFINIVNGFLSYNDLI